MKTQHTFNTVYEDLVSGKEVSYDVVSDLLSDFFHHNFKNISKENMEKLINSNSILCEGYDLGKDLDLLKSLDTFMKTNQITECVLKGLLKHQILIVYENNKTVYSTVIGLDERVS